MKRDRALEDDSRENRVTKVDRRKLLKGTAAGGIATAAAGGLAAPALAQTMPELKWRCTSSFPKSLDTLFGSLEFFCKRVSDLTDGKFQITPFASNEIVPGLQAQDAVSNGTVEMCQTASYYYWGKDPTFTFGTALPFGMNPRGVHAWWYQGGGDALMNEFFKKYNMYGLMFGNTGTQMGGFFRNELKDVEALKGVKMRIGGFAGSIVSRLGMIPQQLAAGEIYQALEKGTIDAAEWVGPYDDEKLGFVKVAKFYHYPGWWEPNSTTNFIASVEKYNALPKNYQQALQTACMETTMSVMAKYDAVNAAALKRLASQGATLTPFSPEIMDACYKASHELYAEINAKNPKFKKLYDSYTTFMADGYLWHQIADYTMDSYMIRYRNQQK